MKNSRKPPRFGLGTKAGKKPRWAAQIKSALFKSKKPPDSSSASQMGASSSSPASRTSGLTGRRKDDTPRWKTAVRRILKWSAFGVAAFAFLLAAVLGLSSVFIDQSLVTSLVKDSVSKQTGGKIEFSWKKFSFVSGFEMSDVALYLPKTDAGFSDGGALHERALFTAKKIGVFYDLSTLWRLKAQLHEAALHAPSVYVEKDGEVFSFSGLIAYRAKHFPSPPEGEKPQASSQPSQVFPSWLAVIISNLYSPVNVEAKNIGFTDFSLEFHDVSEGLSAPTGSTKTKSGPVVSKKISLRGLSVLNELSFSGFSSRFSSHVFSEADGLKISALKDKPFDLTVDLTAAITNLRRFELKSNVGLADIVGLGFGIISEASSDKASSDKASAEKPGSEKTSSESTSPKYDDKDKQKSPGGQKHRESPLDFTTEISAALKENFLALELTSLSASLGDIFNVEAGGTIGWPKNHSKYLSVDFKNTFDLNLNRELLKRLSSVFGASLSGALSQSCQVVGALNLEGKIPRLPVTDCFVGISELSASYGDMARLEAFSGELRVSVKDGQTAGDYVIEPEFDFSIEKIWGEAAGFEVDIKNTATSLTSKIKTSGDFISPRSYFDLALDSIKVKKLAGSVSTSTSQPLEPIESSGNTSAAHSNDSPNKETDQTLLDESLDVSFQVKTNDLSREHQLRLSARLGTLLSTELDGRCVFPCSEVGLSGKGDLKDFEKILNSAKAFLDESLHQKLPSRLRGNLAFSYDIKSSLPQKLDASPYDLFKSSKSEIDFSSEIKLLDTELLDPPVRVSGLSIKTGLGLKRDTVTLTNQIELSKLELDDNAARVMVDGVRTDAKIITQIPVDFDVQKASASLTFSSAMDSVGLELKSSNSPRVIDTLNNRKSSVAGNDGDTGEAENPSKSQKARSSGSQPKAHVLKNMRAGVSLAVSTPEKITVEKANFSAGTILSADLSASVVMPPLPKSEAEKLSWSPFPKSLDLEVTTKVDLSAVPNYMENTEASGLINTSLKVSLDAEKNVSVKAEPFFDDIIVKAPEALKDFPIVLEGLSGKFPVDYFANIDELISDFTKSKLSESRDFSQVIKDSVAARKSVEQASSDRSRNLNNQAVEGSVNESPIQIRAVRVGGFEVENINVNASLDSSGFYVDNVEFVTMNGVGNARLFIALTPLPSRITGSMHLADINTEEIPYRLKKQAVPAEIATSFFSMNSHIDYLIDDQTMNGDVNITKIGKVQASYFLDLLDPKKEDGNINNARLGLKLGYPNGIAIPIRNGLMDINLDIRSLGIPIPIPDVKGFPVVSLIENIRQEKGL